MRYCNSLRSFFSIIIAFLIPFSIIAQDADNQPEPVDTVALVYQQYLVISQQNQQLADSLQRLMAEYKAVTMGFDQVSTRVDGLNDNLSNSLEQVNRLTTNDLLSKEGRLRTKQAKIIATSKFIKSANNSFDAIDASLATSDYLNDVGQLNSPTNEDLGFSLNDEVVKMLDDLIIKADPKFNNKNPDKFKEFITSMIENPITTAVASSVPALSAIGAVVDLVANVSVREKGVTPADFRNFKNSLGKYIKHYEQLAQASYDFNANLDNLRVKTDALRVVLTDFTLDRIRTLEPQAIDPKMSNSDKRININDLITMHYQYDRLQQKMDVILAAHKKNGRMNYQAALDEPKLSYPLYALNQAQFIQQELESITNEYASNYQLYHDRLKRILEDSKSLSKDTEKVDKKLEELDYKLTRLVDSFKRNVKIREVNLYLQDIPAY